MSRIGGKVSALEVFNKNALRDPWVSLITADQTEPDKWMSRGPRCLRLWASRGLQGAKGFRARIVFGAGDVAYEFPIGDRAGNLANIPSQGLALPMPEAQSVRVDVAWSTPALLPPAPEAALYATITHGAPVVTTMPGGTLLAQAAANVLTIDPEDYPFASSLKIVNVGPVLGATLQVNGGAIYQMAINTSYEVPFVVPYTLSNVIGSALFYSIVVIS